MPFVKAIVGGACAVVVCSGSALAGPDWIENGDAGPLIGNAQRTLGSGQLNSISGSLSLGFGLGGGNDLEDMYLIQVLDPVNFSMTISGADFDPQIFIFNVTEPGEAFGLLGNLDSTESDIPFLGPQSNDGTGAQISLPGVYAVAISGAGRLPVSLGGEIFDFRSPTEISGPDGPGGLNPHNGWIGDGEVGSYTVEIEGGGFYDVPGPGGLPVLALMALAGGRRRRR